MAARELGDHFQKILNLLYLIDEHDCTLFQVRNKLDEQEERLKALEDHCYVTLATENHPQTGQLRLPFHDEQDQEWVEEEKRRANKRRRATEEADADDAANTKKVWVAGYFKTVRPRGPKKLGLGNDEEETPHP